MAAKKKKKDDDRQDKLVTCSERLVRVFHDMRKTQGGQLDPVNVAFSSYAQLEARVKAEFGIVVDHFRTPPLPAPDGVDDVISDRIEDTADIAKWCERDTKKMQAVFVELARLPPKGSEKGDWRWCNRSKQDAFRLRAMVERYNTHGHAIPTAEANTEQHRAQYKLSRMESRGGGIYNLGDVNKEIP